MVAPTVVNVPRTHTIPTLADVDAALSAFAGLYEPPRELGSGGYDLFLRASPGVVEFRSRRVDTVKPLRTDEGFNSLWEDAEMTHAATIDDRPKRGRITGWSDSSRRNMRLQFAKLDYSPFFAAARDLPRMVTLTMPHDWEHLAPTSQAFKKNLVDNVVRRYFRRHWGYDLAGVWKMEFQNRQRCADDGCHDPRAPHLHMLVAAPSGTCPATGESFETWLRRVWANACRTDDEDAYLDHLAKGVHVEVAYGMSGRDSKRIADYFSKHGAFRSKDYQNTPPEIWDTPGRYWGYWHLSKADAEVPLARVADASTGPNGATAKATDSPNYVSSGRDDREVFDHAKRIARRWARANGKHRKVRMTVPDLRLVHQPGFERQGMAVVNTSTGEVHTRRLSFWRGPLVGGSNGFVAVNNGPGFVRDLARALDLVAPPDVVGNVTAGMEHSDNDRRSAARRGRYAVGAHAARQAALARVHAARVREVDFAAAVRALSDRRAA